MAARVRRVWEGCALVSLVYDGRWRMALSPSFAWRRIQFIMYSRVLRDQVQLPCHIQREFQVHERLFGMMDGARGHLEIGAVVVEVVDGRADEHADAHGPEARAPDGG